VKIPGTRRRLDARSTYLMTLAGALAYFAGQIIYRPTSATQQGLTPVADLVSMESTGWSCMGIAGLVAFCAVFRKRCWWVDRCGFALGTFPLVMWFASFAWTWFDQGADLYPVGGVWGFLAVFTAIANVKLDRGAQIGKADHGHRDR
jgi:hypothetical protein